MGGAEVSAAVLAGAREMIEAKAKVASAEAKVRIVEPMAKYLVETFGCQMNQHDSERMAGLLEQAGYEATAEAREADVVVVNTCSVRERAEEKLYTRLEEIRQASDETGRMPVVAVAGCVAQQEGNAILKRTNLVDVIIGTQSLKQLPALVAQAAARITSSRMSRRGRIRSLPRV